MEKSEIAIYSDDAEIQSRIDELFKKGMTAFNNRDYPMAVVFFHQSVDLVRVTSSLINLYPNIYYQLSYTYFLLKKRDSAVEYAKLIDHEKILRPSAAEFYKRYQETLEKYVTTG